MSHLCWARLLVAMVPFARWRTGLGHTGHGGDAKSSELAQRLAADVQWAARRLPVATKCLPQAMALSWMLRRRGVGHSVVIAVRPADLRPSPDALHAWVEVGGRKLIGDLPGPWVEAARLGEASRG